MNSPSAPGAVSVLKSSSTSPNAWTSVPMTRPRLVRAVDADVAPVPPLLIASVEVDVIAPPPRSISPSARVVAPVPPTLIASVVVAVNA